MLDSLYVGMTGLEGSPRACASSATTSPPQHPGFKARTAVRGPVLPRRIGQRVERQLSAYAPA